MILFRLLQKRAEDSCEHSHGLNLLIHFINHLNLGKINKINSSIYFNKNNKINYDYVNFINFKNR